MIESGAARIPTTASRRLSGSAPRAAGLRSHTADLVRAYRREFPDSRPLHRRIASNPQSGRTLREVVAATKGDHVVPRIDQASDYQVRSATGRVRAARVDELGLPGRVRGRQSSSGDTESSRGVEGGEDVVPANSTCADTNRNGSTPLQSIARNPSIRTFAHTAYPICSPPNAATTAGNPA